MRKYILLLSAVLMALFTAPPARADFHVWTGAVSGYWSNTNNWQGGDAPHVFESAPIEVDFPAGATRTSVTNDINFGLFGALAVDSIVVAGNNYLIAGKGAGTNLVLTGNPAPFFGLNLENLYCTGSNITFDSSLNLILENTNTITNSASSTLFIQSLITGAGGLTFMGEGSLTFDGDTNNTFTGAFDVQSGTVYLDNFGYTYIYGDSYKLTFDVDCVSIGGSLIIGTTNPVATANVYVQRGNQFTSNCDVTINQGSALHFGRLLDSIYDQDNNSDATLTNEIRSLVLNGGLLDVGEFAFFNEYFYEFGTNVCSLTIDGNCVSDPSPSPTTPQIGGLGNVGFTGGTFNVSNDLLLVYCNMEGLVKSGPGSLVLVGSNQIGELVIAQGLAYAESSNLQMYDLTVSNGGQMNIEANCGLFGNLDLSGFGLTSLGAALNVESASVTDYVDNVYVSGDAAINLVNPTDQFILHADRNDSYVGGTNNLYKMGAGTLKFQDFVPNFPEIAETNSAVPISNLFSGTLFIQGGTVELNSADTNSYYWKAGGIALNGPIVIGTNGSTTACYLILDTNQQLNANVPITINDGCGLEFLGGSSQSVGSLILNGGGVDFGTVILYGDLTAQNGVNAPGFFFADLSLGGTNRTLTVAPNSTFTILGGLVDGGNNAGFTKAGLGTLALAGNGAYGGVTTVNAGRLSVQDGAALGGTAAGTIIAPGAELDLGGQVNVGAEPLNLAGAGVDGLGAFKGSGTNSWAGPITLTGATTFDIAANSLTLLSGVISGGSAGTLVKSGLGALEFGGNATNSYTGTTIVQQGALSLSRTNATSIPGPLIIGNDVDGPDAETVFLLQNSQLTPTSPLTINPSGLLNVGNGNYVTANVGALTGSGAILISDGGLGVGNDNSSSVFAGSISGSGAFDKNGAGTLTLTGNGSLSGPVYIVGGQLLVNGSLASATMNVYPSTVLGGVGTVGPIIGSGAVNPGTGGPGILNSGNLSFASGSAFTPILNGASPGNYSQLNVAGTVNLTGAGLQLTQGTMGAVSNHYTIINNDGADAVTGIFAGLPEGATVVANNGAHFSISYKAGTGNDVVLTQTGLPVIPEFTGIIKTGGGPSTLNGTGLSNTIYHVQATTNLATTNWVTLGPVAANGLGVLSFIDSSSTNYPVRFYRIVYP